MFSSTSSVRCGSSPQPTPPSSWRASTTRAMPPWIEPSLSSGQSQVDRRSAVRHPGNGARQGPVKPHGPQHPRPPHPRLCIRSRWRPHADLRLRTSAAAATGIRIVARARHANRKASVALVTESVGVVVAGAGVGTLVGIAMAYLLVTVLDPFCAPSRSRHPRADIAALAALVLAVSVTASLAATTLIRRLPPGGTAR